MGLELDEEQRGERFLLFFYFQLSSSIRLSKIIHQQNQFVLTYYHSLPQIRIPSIGSMPREEEGKKKKK